MVLTDSSNEVPYDVRIRTPPANYQKPTDQTQHTKHKITLRSESLFLNTRSADWRVIRQWRVLNDNKHGYYKIISRWCLNLRSEQPREGNWSWGEGVEEPELFIFIPIIPRSLTTHKVCLEQKFGRIGTDPDSYPLSSDIRMEEYSEESRNMEIGEKCEIFISRF